MKEPSDPTGSAVQAFDVEYESGRALCEAWWNSLGDGGVALPRRLAAARGEAVRLRVRVGDHGPFAADAVVAGHAGARTFVRFVSRAQAAPIRERVWQEAATPRRHWRVALGVPARFGPPRAPEQPCTVIDLGPGGACLTSARHWPADTPVVLRVGPLRLIGRVRWSVCGRLGVAFSGAWPVPQVVAAWLAHRGSAA